MQKNKILSILLSIGIAFGLWLYVVTFVSSESSETVYNIPIALEAEAVLAERNLMITGIADDDVTMTLIGSRSDLGKVDRDNITLKVDLTKIYDAGVHELEYSISFPGDVSNNSINVDSKYPGTIAITVEKKQTKAVPVEINYTGSAPEGYLTEKEEAILDYTEVKVTGPLSVVDQIESARIDVDLNHRTESISESYRYTLCDAEGNPVDVELVTTNVAEVRLELAIKRFEEVPLTVNLVYGGGAQSHTTNVSIEPKTIRVSGSEALLAEFTEINLGTIELAAITEDTELTSIIALPEGIANLSGIDEAVIKISFIGLSTKEFTVDQIHAVNVPEGMEYDLISQVLKVTLRGETALINSIKPEDIVITVNFSGVEPGTSTVKASVSVKGDDYREVGALGTLSVSVTLRAAGD